MKRLDYWLLLDNPKSKLYNHVRVPVMLELVMLIYDKDMAMKSLLKPMILVETISKVWVLLTLIT